MSFFQKLSLFAFFLGLSACTHKVNLLTTEAMPSPRSFAKILVVEDCPDDRLFLFFNNLRKDLRREFAQRQVSVEFVRNVPNLENWAQRLAEARAKLQPEAEMTLAVENAEYREKGPLHNDVRAAHLHAELSPSGEKTASWQALISIKNFWGADVDTDLASEILLKKMLADGVVK